MSEHAYGPREQALELAKAVVLDESIASGHGEKALSKALVSYAADNDRLRAAITTAVEALRKAHQRLFGEATCWSCEPTDSDWPCVSRMVADDLAAAVGGEHA